MLIKQLKESIAKGAKESIIPEELIKVFNKDLPDDLQYKSYGDGILIVDLNNTKNTISFRRADNLSFFNKYEKYIKSGEDVLKIAYLTQTKLKISDNKVEYKGTEIEKKKQVRSIYNEDNVNVESGYLVFPSLPKISLEISDETDDENKLTVILQMQKCDNIKKIVYTNADQKSAIHFTVIKNSEYSSENASIFNLTATIVNTNAKSFSELIKAYKIYKALINDHFKINGVKIQYSRCVKDENNVDIIDADKEEIDISLKIFNKIHDLEEELGKSFDPSENINENDLQTIRNLHTCLVEKKAYKLNKRLNEVTFNKEDNEELTSNVKEGYLYDFCVKGNIELTLLGQDIEACYLDIYRKVKVKNEINLSDGMTKVIFESEITDNEFSNARMIYKDESEALEALKNRDLVEKICKQLDDK